jgi:hypothetical protein
VNTLLALPKEPGQDITWGSCTSAAGWWLSIQSTVSFALPSGERVGAERKLIAGRGRACLAHVLAEQPG